MQALKIYLIRHGETVYNIQKRMQGSSDSPLTDKGIQQAKVCSIALQDINFTAAYSSTQLRAINTCRYIMDDKNIPFFQHLDLCEMAFGDWEHKTEQEINQPETYNNFRHNVEAYDPSSYHGETFLQVLERANKAINDIIQIHDSGNILVVSHGSVIRLLLQHFNGGDWRLHKQEIPVIENLSINILDVKKRNDDLIKIKIEKMNHVPWQ